MIFRARAPLAEPKLKTESYDYLWHPKHTHTVCGAVLILSHQYSWKMFRSNFDKF